MKENLPPATTWMKLEDGLLSKISQTQRLPYIWSEKQKDHKHRDVMKC